MITRAYKAFYLGGTPSQRTGTGPPGCLRLKNRLYMTSYVLIGKHAFGEQVFGEHAFGIKTLLFLICLFQVSKDVEKEKMAAIIARNKLKSMTKAREQEQQQLQVKSFCYSI